jgi:hypothetical protein
VRQGRVGSNHQIGQLHERRGIDKGSAVFIDLATEIQRHKVPCRGAQLFRAKTFLHADELDVGNGCQRRKELQGNRTLAVAGRWPSWWSAVS